MLYLIFKPIFVIQAGIRARRAFSYANLFNMNAANQTPKTFDFLTRIKWDRQNFVIWKS